MDLYKFDIKSKNEFQVLENLVTLYSCYRTLTGKKGKMLRSKLVTLLCIYIKHGYNSESKDIACRYLDLKKQNLNCLNSELRDGGFLIKNDMNNRESYLNEELQQLSDYYRLKDSRNLPEFFKVEGENPLLIMFSLYADGKSKNFN
jgi:hypothetical protein